MKPWTFFAPLAALAKPVAIKPFALIAAKANVLNVFDLSRRKIVRFQLAIIETKIAGAPIAAHSTSGASGSGIHAKARAFVPFETSPPQLPLICQPNA